jgi:polysaccharide biosynthesis/export protein
MRKYSVSRRGAIMALQILFTIALVFGISCFVLADSQSIPDIGVKDQLEPRVMVLGAVAQPGQYRFTPRMTLHDAIELAGNITSSADTAKCLIMRLKASILPRLDHSQLIECEAGADVALENNDIIVIQKQVESSVYVLGFAVKPGTYPYKEKLTLFDALNMASGPTARGSLLNVRIIRQNCCGKAQTIYVDMEKVLRQPQADPVIQRGDIIYLPESGHPRPKGIIMAR